MERKRLKDLRVALYLECTRAIRPYSLVLSRERPAERREDLDASLASITTYLLNFMLAQRVLRRPECDRKLPEFTLSRSLRTEHG